MRTISFQSVYEAVLRRHGLDPLGDAITHDTARAIAEHVTERASTAWAMWEWPDLMPTEERAYRPPWNDTTQYRRVNADGFPDQVYYIAPSDMTDQPSVYYTVNPNADSDPPWGDPPTAHPIHWHVFTPTTFIDRDQATMRPMGQVFGVYGSDPSLNGCCTQNCLRFRPSEKGITICDGPPGTVFIQYLLPEPEYTMVPFISGKAYAAGDRVFNVSDGNCYRCIADNNNQPPPNVSYWVLEPVPAMFATYLKEGAYADSLIETFVSGEDQVRLARAAAASAKADQFLEGMIDDLLEQGQKYYYIHHRYPHVSWRYDGMLQWPTTGWCCTRQWNGNIVYPLTGPYSPPPPPGEIVPPEVTAALSGITPLVSGQSYIDVAFATAQPDARWIFIECRIVNLIDVAPLNVWPGIVTAKTGLGFRLQLNGVPETANYKLDWSIKPSGLPVAGEATSYLFLGPGTGPLGAPTTFVVSLPVDTSVPGPVTIAFHDGGAGGTFA